MAQAPHPAAAGFGQDHGPPVLALHQPSAPEFHQGRGRLGLAAASVVQVIVAGAMMMMALVPSRLKIRMHIAPLHIWAYRS